MQKGQVTMEQTRKKIGGIEIQVSIDFLKALREKVKAIPPGQSYLTMAKSLAADFPDMSLRVIQTYCPVVDRTSDYLFGLMADGKITTGMFQELCQGELDTGTRDTLANIVMEKWVVGRNGVKARMSPRHIAIVKKLLKDSKGRCSLAEAVMKATGEIPPHAKPDHVGETKKTFGKAVASSTDMAVKFMTAMQMALDLIPGSAVESGEIHLDSYEKLTTFEVTLENALGFVRARKKQWMEYLKTHIVAEAQMAQDRISRGG